MAHTDTLAADSGATQKKRLDPRTEHIFPILYIEAIRDHDTLDKHDSAYRALKRKNIKVSRALWAGVCALDTVALKYLRSALNDGKLLMCWEGSKVIDLAKGGAA